MGGFLKISIMGMIKKNTIAQLIISNPLDIHVTRVNTDTALTYQADLSA